MKTFWSVFFGILSAAAVIVVIGGVVLMQQQAAAREAQRRLMSDLSWRNLACLNAEYRYIKKQTSRADYEVFRLHYGC